MARGQPVRTIAELARSLGYYPSHTPIKVLMEHENGTETVYAIKHVIGTNDDKEVEIVLGEVTG